MAHVPTQNRVDQVLSSQGDGSGRIEMAVAGVSITAATTASPVVCTATTHGYVAGDWIFIDGATGTTEINGLRQVNTVPDANTFTLKDESGDVINSAGTFGGTVDSNIAVVIKPAATETYKLARMNGWGADSAAIDIDGFLGVAALSNGINVQYWSGNDGQFYDLLAKPITAWLDWALVVGGSDVPTEVATNKTIGGIRWTFNRNVEGGIGTTNVTLDGSAGDFLAVWTQDDLDGIDVLRFSVQGVK